MQQKAVSQFNFSLKAGGILGIVLILVSVIYYLTGNMLAKSSQWIGYAIMIIGVVAAQIGYKKLLGGFMTYGQALRTGVLTMLFASVLSGIYTYLLYAFIDPTIPRQLRRYTEEQLIRQGNVPEDQIGAAVDFMAKFQTPVMAFVVTIVGGLLIGLIISLITSIFTQKKPPEVDVE